LAPSWFLGVFRLIIQMIGCTFSVKIVVICV
jgi:hypothetical protein